MEVTVDCSGKSDNLQTFVVMSITTCSKFNGLTILKYCENVHSMSVWNAFLSDYLPRIANCHLAETWIIIYTPWKCENEIVDVKELGTMPHEQKLLSKYSTR